MDGHSISRSLGTDILAGACVSAALAWAIWTFGVSPAVILCIAAIAFIRVFASLRRLHTAPQFHFQQFEPASLDFVPQADGLEIALDQLAASIGNVAAGDHQAPPLPTVREMQQSIRDRLNALEAKDGLRDDESEAADPAEESRAAIDDRRRARF